MKKKIRIAGTMLMWASGIGQVNQAFALEDSQNVWQDDGYVLFIYPAGWNQYGETMSRQLIADESVQAAADDAVLMPAPIYQNRSEENKKKAADVMGALTYPGDMSNISYPAIVFYEKGGRAYATLCGERLMNSDVAEVKHDLKPDSTLGKAAVVVARDWVREYRYGQGRSPDTTPTKGAAVVMKNIPVQKPGSYTISFKLTDGRDGIPVNKMRLMDGKKSVLTIDEPVEINWRATEQSRMFRVCKMLKNPALEMTFGNDSDKRSSWGEISIHSN